MKIVFLLLRWTKCANFVWCLDKNILAYLRNRKRNEQRKVAPKEIGGASKVGSG